MTHPTVLKEMVLKNLSINVIRLVHLLLLDSLFTAFNPVVPADSSSSIPADNVPAGSSSSIPADYVSAGHVLVSADRDRIC
ncbi:hypothetical protein Tco_0134568 [Tanacetum coccineum]